MSMNGRVRFYLASSMVLLLALAGCGRSLLQTGERAAWRHQAEVTCLKSGSVKIGTGVVQIEPIEGPGMCGADFPLKVAALGESSAIGYAEDPRPPGAIPNASDGQMPRWPLSERRYAPAVRSAPVQIEPVQSQPAQGRMSGEQLRWVPGPPAIERPQVTQPQYTRPQYTQPQYSEPEYRQPDVTQPAGRPVSLNPPGVSPDRDDIPDDAILPPGRGAAPRAQPDYIAPIYRRSEPPPQRALPSLGPMRGPQATGSIMPATLSPTATLACPLVSALDRWVSEGVQPAALHWFGTQVVTIKQISAYSCRSMVGAGTRNISEHAFGNALDVAGFVLADGRKIIVKTGWRGTPEEQGFLHDVQLYACETFNTVLAPGYNAAHYDHIHVDLMRRSSGRRPCRPDAIPGEVVAAKARAVYASKQRGPAYTGSIATRAAKLNQPPSAIPGEDGFVADADDDAAVTGSISRKPAKPGSVAPGEDGDFDDDVTGSISARSRKGGGWPRTTGDAAVRFEELRAKSQ